MTDDLSPDLKALKTTTRKLVEDCGGPVACKVLLDGKSPSLISAYGNPNERPSAIPRPRFMPLDDVMALERYAGRAVVSAWLVERHKTNPDRARRELSELDLVRMAKEGADAMSAIAEAMADRRICGADKVRIARELRDAIALYSELLEAVEDVG